MISKTVGISVSVGEKAVTRRLLNRAFNSVIAMIKCNFPQEMHSAVIRLWGFQKERY
jgi:hypothetical protein